MFNRKEWYEKTKEQRKIWEKAYYEKNKERIIEVHKDWAKKNLDQGGSIWIKYGRQKRFKNPFLDKEYRIRKKLLI